MSLECLSILHESLKSNFFEFKGIFSYKKKNIRNWRFVNLSPTRLYCSFFFTKSNSLNDCLTQFILNKEFKIIKSISIKIPNVSEWTYFAKTDNRIIIQYNIEMSKSHLVTYNYQLEKINFFQYEEEELQESALVGADDKYIYMSEVTCFLFKAYDIDTFQKVYVINNIEPYYTESLISGNSIKQICSVSNRKVLLDETGLKIFDQNSNIIISRLNLNDALFFKIKDNQIIVFMYDYNNNHLKISSFNLNFDILCEKIIYLKDLELLRNNHNLENCFNFDFEGGKLYILDTIRETLKIFE